MPAQVRIRFSILHRRRTRRCHSIWATVSGKPGLWWKGALPKLRTADVQRTKLLALRCISCRRQHLAYCRGRPRSAWSDEETYCHSPVLHRRWKRKHHHHKGRARSRSCSICCSTLGSRSCWPSRLIAPGTEQGAEKAGRRVPHTGEPTCCDWFCLGTGAGKDTGSQQFASFISGTHLPVPALVSS